MYRSPRSPISVTAWKVGIDFAKIPYQLSNGEEQLVALQLLFFSWFHGAVGDFEKCPLSILMNFVNFHGVELQQQTELQLLFGRWQLQAQALQG